MQKMKHRRGLAIVWHSWKPGELVGGRPKDVDNERETLEWTENANKLGSTTEEINYAHKINNGWVTLDKQLHIITPLFVPATLIGRLGSIRWKLCVAHFPFLMRKIFPPPLEASSPQSHLAANWKAWFHSTFPQQTHPGRNCIKGNK